MLMRLLWAVVRPMVTPLVAMLPEAPEPVDIVIPWPAWLPFWPFAAVLGSVFLVGVAALALRTLRWVYGLIPVVQ